MAVSQVCKLSHPETYDYRKRELDLVLCESTKMVIFRTTSYCVFYLWEISQGMRLLSS